MEGRYLLMTEADREAEEWKSILGFLEQENIQQKNKLAEILRSSENKNEFLLDVAEQFQSQFLLEDEALRLMWNDLAELESSIKEEISESDTDVNEIIYRQNRLREEIQTLQLNFEKLKSRFLDFFETYLNRIIVNK